MPHAVLVDGIISQQWTAHELQVGLHGGLPGFESLGTVKRAKLRKGNFVHEQAGLKDEWITS